MCEEELETRRVWCGERTAGLLVVVVCLLLPKVPAHCSSGHRHPIKLAEWKQKGPQGPAGCLRKARQVKGVLKLAAPAQPAECPSALHTGKSQRTHLPQPRWASIRAALGHQR